MKYPIIIILFMLLVCSCFASEKAPIAISRFLATAEHDETLIYQNEKISFLKQSSSNTPFLNEVEFRTKIDQFESDKQTYAIRLKPNGWGEAEDGKIVYHTSLKYNEAQHDLLLNNALKCRYSTVIDYLHYHQMLVLSEALLLLYEERVTVLKQSADDINFNPNDLIDAENEMIQSELDLINLKNNIVNIEDEIRKNMTAAETISFSPNPPAPFPERAGGDIISTPLSVSGRGRGRGALIANRYDTGGVVGIAQIGRMLESISMAEEREHVHLEKARLSWELAGAMYQLEQSENRKYLTYVEAAYNMNNRRDFDKAFSVEFGISIPIVNPNRLDTNRRTLDTLKAVSDYANMKREITEKTGILSRDIRRLISQYNVLQEKKQDTKSQSSLDIYRRMSGINPLILLKLKESILKTDIAIQKITHQIYEKYIRLLDISGKLSVKPLRNYLSDNSEIIPQ